MVQFEKSPLVLGGGMSLTSVIDLMDEVSASNANYKYTKTIADHIRKVAHPSVRNAGTIAGNLMLKHAYPGNSDFFSTRFHEIFGINKNFVKLHNIVHNI